VDGALEQGDALSRPVEHTVELRGLVKRYGATTALDGISLGIRPGEFFTLLGPSGCGKTTTLRSVAGFVTPDAGDVLIDAMRVNGVPPHRRRVGMVFQHYALFPHRTVTQNVAFGLRMQRVPKDEITRRVAEALRLVQLPDHGGRYPRELSGGEQQRVAIARAFANSPRILFADEPTGNLDATTGGRVLELLESLNRESGSTIVLVTHDTALASRAGRKIRLHDGMIVEDTGAAS
jgi:ABC-type Fe3+/spermidine/putrescine transport system ATPase subunit